MIISVPMSWKVFQSSGSSRVSLMLPCRYASGAMEGGAAPLKPGFKSADEEKLSKSGFLEGKKETNKRRNLTSDGLHAATFKHRTSEKIQELFSCSGP